LDGERSLRETIRSIPVPGAPPRFSKDAAAVGLSFLDTVLRLNHVRRLTDRLTVVEHRVAHRITEVDISLTMLDEGQRSAADLFQVLRGWGSQGAPQNDPASPRIWVPVTRIPRTTVMPIDVTDSTGNRLPRLTQYETARLMASAMYRLLRGVLTGNPDATVPEKPLAQLLFQEHQARWLIQSAIITLLSDRSAPDIEQANPGVKPDLLHGHAAKCRDFALQVLIDYREYLGHFFNLLDIVANDYLLVVGLDAARDEHLLRYDAPLTEISSPGIRNSVGDSVRASLRGYKIHYTGQISPNLRSYHLVVDTEPGVEIKCMYLATNADETAAQDLVEDLRVVRDRLANEAPKPVDRSSNKILELGIQATLRRLADLLRRRQWDASRTGKALSPEQFPACLELSRIALAGEARPGQNNEPDNAILRNDSLTVERLDAAAKEIMRNDLHLDLMMENDPGNSTAHAYWRRQSGRSANSSPIDVRAGMILSDTTSEGPRGVAAYAFSIVAIAYLTAALLARHPWPLVHVGSFTQELPSGAVVTVLLLVPGYLYSRLSMPGKHTISAHLRTLPRFVARLCITIMAALAVATAAAAPLLPLSFGVAIVLAFLGGLLLLVRRPDVEPTRQLAELNAPQWAIPGRNEAQHRVYRADANFVSYESRDERP